MGVSKHVVKMNLSAEFNISDARFKTPIASSIFFFPYSILI